MQPSFEFLSFLKKVFAINKIFPATDYTFSFYWLQIKTVQIIYRLFDVLNINIFSHKNIKYSEKTPLHCSWCRSQGKPEIVRDFFNPAKVRENQGILVMVREFYFLIDSVKDFRKKWIVFLG